MFTFQIEMVCVPCFLVPFLLFLWRFLQPYVLMFWNPNKGIKEGDKCQKDSLFSCPCVNESSSSSPEAEAVKEEEKKEQ